MLAFNFRRMNLYDWPCITVLEVSKSDAFD